MSCSCASGPAFEGAHIQDGMRAAPGAIERIQIVDGEIRYQTVDGQPPIGICGSGILDAVAEMLDDQAVDRRGAMRDEHERVAAVEGKKSFLLVHKSASGHQRDITLLPKDIYEIQLAKSAIRAGIDVLLDQVGLHYEAIDSFIIAGAFGTYLDLRSAIRVGMFPPLPLERFRQVGNAAGIGAKQMLISSERRRRANAIAQRVEYIELATHPLFFRVFMDALTF